MAEDKKVKQVANRIAYVEPNDIYGSYDGVPLTPNYEDLCISFNLVAEKVNRFNSNEYQGTNTVEGYHRQIRKVIKNKGVFPSDTSLEKFVYLAYCNIRKKWTMPIVNRGQISQ